MTFNELSEMEAEVKRQANGSALLGAKYAVRWAIQYLEKAGCVQLALNATQVLQGAEDQIWVLGYHPSPNERTTGLKSGTASILKEGE